jgi:hypothetical protein
VKRGGSGKSFNRKGREGGAKGAKAMQGGELGTKGRREALTLLDLERPLTCIRVLDSITAIRSCYFRILLI